MKKLMKKIGEFQRNLENKGKSNEKSIKFTFHPTNRANTLEFLTIDILESPNDGIREFLLKIALRQP